MITAQPSDVRVTAGQMAAFSVGVSGAAVYRWQSSNGSGSWTDIRDATAATYTFMTGISDTGGQFRVIVMSRADPANTIISSAATLTVDAVPQPIEIDVQPRFSGVAYEGQAWTLSVTASGTSPAYRWQRSGDGGATWTDIASAAGPTYTATATLPDDGALLRVVVSNVLGQQISNPTALAVQPIPASPVITSYPLDATVPAGQTATFNAVAVGNPAPTLQWQTAFEVGGPWTDVATGGTYTTPPTTIADDGRLLRVTATNANGTHNAGASLHITTTALAPLFFDEPADVAVATGAAAIFRARGYGAPSVTYQWQLSSDGGRTFGNINGATNRVYSLMPAGLADSGKVLRVIVSNNLGSVPSRAAQLTVMDAPTMDAIDPGARWLPGVTGAYFRTRARGEQLRYQWQLGASAMGAPLDVAGATAADFELPASTPGSVDQVCVTVSNPVGSVKQCVPVAAITWRSLLTAPMVGPITAIASVGTSTAVAGGANGTLLRSTDAGLTWTVVSEASWLDSSVAVIAMRGQNGVALGDNETRFTADGGRRWYSGPHTFAAKGVAYAPDGTLVQVGGTSLDSQVRLSADNGLTWRAGAIEPGFTLLSRVAFSAAGVGIAIGTGPVNASGAGNTGVIARSADGGATWLIVRRTDSPVVGAVAFASDSLVICTDWQGNFWRSTDAGLTWTSQSSGSGDRLGALAFLSASVGVAFNDAGQVLRTADGGATWAVIGTARGAKAITPMDVNTLLAGRSSGAPMRSVDGGFSWTTSGTPDGPDLAATAFADASTGVVVGSGGAILRTTDAGRTWRPVESGFPVPLLDVRFGDASRGLAIGASGVMLRTSDAGASWQPAAWPAQPSDPLLTLAYAAPNVAFVGSSRGLWRTSDGGTTWQSAGDFGSFPQFYCVRFGDALHGLAAAQNRQLWRTTDGGQTWSVVTTNLDGDNSVYGGIRDLSFVTPTIVVAVTGDNRIVRSTDAGATWQGRVWSGLTSTSRVFFRDAQVGIIVGDGVLRTTDGGLTWTRDQGALRPYTVGGVAAVGAHSMIIVGSPNLIYRSDDF